MDINLFILVIVLGIIAGTITGLIPGIHINMVSMLLLTNLTLLLGLFEEKLLIVFIITMGTVHTFVDFIPSILFGVPSVDTALSVLPAHRLVLEGKAYTAIFLSSIGSLFGGFFAIILSGFLYFILSIIYDSIKKYIPFVLILTIIILVLGEKSRNKKFWAIIIILFSGSFGILILNSRILDSPLLVLFTGLFGVSTLLYSLKDENSTFPSQDYKINFKFSNMFFKSVIIGGFSSAVCSITPGIGNAQAATISTLFIKKITQEYFIIITSAINTINFILSFITFYLIDKSRNGSVYVISQIVESVSLEDLYFYFAIIFFISFIGFFLTMFLGKKLIQIVSKINFRIVNYAILFLILGLVFYMTGMYGMLILITTTCLGIMAISLEVRRVHLMSVLLIPVVFNLI